MGDEGFIEARGLALRRGDHPLLTDINLRLNRGEHWLIWGPSGAGKTSLARILAGLTAPSEGELSFAAPAPHAMLFQDPDSQLAAATVRDEIALGARAPGEAPGAASVMDRVDEALRRFDLLKFADRNPHTLSGGEKRRLGLAALSVLGCEILILDEPELHLDESSWAESLRFLDEWRSQDSRLLIEISRDPARALLADGIILLRKGHLVAAGPPREVYQSHFAVDLPRVEEFEKESAPQTIPRQPASRGEVILSARDLHLNLPGGQTLISELNLELHRGERVLLTGGNGSGKSTLLLLLADLADPDSGKIERSPNLVTALALQDPERTFFAETVEEEIAFAPSRQGLRGDALARRVSQAMAALGLPASLRGRDPISLSAGEMRRLALASLMALDPDFLYMDEPASGMDPENARLFAENLFATGNGFLWADCRSPVELESRFDRRYTLSGGKLVEVGS